MLKDDVNFCFSQAFLGYLWLACGLLCYSEIIWKGLTSQAKD